MKVEIREEKMTKKAFIKVMLKEEVLDPQGKAVLSVLKSSGYNNVKDVRVGKYIEIDMEEGKSGSLENEAEEISEKVLSNPLIEEFSIEIK